MNMDSLVIRFFLSVEKLKQIENKANFSSERHQKHQQGGQ